MEHYLGVAREQGIDESKLSAVQGIAMAVSAGKINALMKRIEQKR